MKTGKMTKLLSVILAIAITVISGVTGLAEGQALVVDLTGSATATIPGDVYFALINGYEDIITVVADVNAFDFNKDGAPDASAEYQEAPDDTCILTRLKGAELLTQDYSYTLSEGAYSSITFKLIVPVTGVTLNKSELTLAPGESETLTATVKPDNATNKTVTWSSSDEAVATVSDGKVTAVAPGAATILATTKDGGLTAECPVTVSEKTAEKQEVVITAKNASFVLKTGKSYKITLKDTKGNPVKSVAVVLKVNGKNYTKSTNNNGMASFSLKFTKAGSYKADISFAGNESYEAVSTKVKFTVPKMKTKIIAKNTSFKQKESQTYTYKVTLRDSKKRPANGVTVKLKVNGKTFSAKTNKLGEAKIKLKITKVGLFTATITFPGNTNYSKSEKKVNIRIKQ